MSTVVDAAGTVYKTVKIGDQWWMAEDLRVSRFNNGDAIAFINEYDSAGWVSSVSNPAYCNYPGQSGVVGNLYNQAVLMDPRGIAPVGWHIPTDADWKKLEVAVGMESSQSDRTGWRGTNEGDKLKATGGSRWAVYPGVWASNESGFSAFAGGCRLFDGRYSYPNGVVYSGFWWSVSPWQQNEFWYRHLDYKSSGIFRSHTYAGYAMAVRCVKN